MWVPGRVHPPKPAVGRLTIEVAQCTRHAPSSYSTPSSKCRQDGPARFGASLTPNPQPPTSTIGPTPSSQCRHDIPPKKMESMFPLEANTPASANGHWHPPCTPCTRPPAHPRGHSRLRLETSSTTETQLLSRLCSFPAASRLHPPPPFSSSDDRPVALQCPSHLLAAYPARPALPCSVTTLCSWSLRCLPRARGWSWRAGWRARGSR